MSLSKPTLGSNADYANRIGALFDLVNNGNYPFPATQVPSADANTLDDYEEGTWTPSLGGTATYTSQAAAYTKVGRAVHIQVDLIVNVIGTGSTTAISGMPFTSVSTVQSGYVGFFVSLASSVVFIAAFINGGSTALSISGTTAAAASASTPLGALGNGSRINAGTTYFTT